MSILTLDDLAVQGTTLGVRIDINSPLTESGSLADDARLVAHVDTLSELLERGGKVAILAHQGRPGSDDFAGLSAHAERLDELLSYPVSYCDGTFSAEARRAVSNLREGEAVVLENTRFYSEEYMEFPAEKAAETHLVDRLCPRTRRLRQRRVRGGTPLTALARRLSDPVTGIRRSSYGA